MQLVTVQGSMQLDAPAANAWHTMDTACRNATRVDLTITSPAGAYRSPAMVLDMWLSSPARRLAVYGVPIGTPVARPKSLGGNGSIHENGRCVDISNWSSAAEWLRVNASRFGFSRTIPTEPWHFQHNGTTAAGGGSAGIPQEDFMSLFDDAHPVPNPAVPGGYLAIWISANFGTVKLTSEEWAAVQRKQALKPGDLMPLYSDAQILSRLVQRANAAGIVAEIDGVIDDEAILAKPGATFEIDYTQFDIPTAEDIAAAVDVPTAAENAQAVRDELIAPDA